MIHPLLRFASKPGKGNPPPLTHTFLLKHTHIEFHRKPTQNLPKSNQFHWNPHWNPVKSTEIDWMSPESPVKPTEIHGNPLTAETASRHVSGQAVVIDRYNTFRIDRSPSYPLNAIPLPNLDTQWLSVDTIYFASPSSYPLNAIPLPGQQTDLLVFSCLGSAGVAPPLYFVGTRTACRACWRRDNMPSTRRKHAETQSHSIQHLPCLRQGSVKKMPPFPTETPTGVHWNISWNTLSSPAIHRHPTLEPDHRKPLKSIESRLNLLSSQGVLSMPYCQELRLLLMGCLCRFRPQLANTNIDVSSISKKENHC